MKLLFAAIIILLTVSPVVEAATVDLTGQGASVDLPDSWTSKQQQADESAATSSLILSAINEEKTALLQVQVCPNPHGLLADQSDLVSNVKDDISNQIVAHGGQVQFTGESKIELNNIPAYLIQYTETAPSSKQVLARTYQVAANGKLYLLSLRTFDTTADADLQAIANSFRFATPPVLPTPTVPGHRIRYFLMAGAGAVALIAAIIGVVVYRRRQLYE